MPPVSARIRKRDRIRQQFQEFFAQETAGGILLGAAAICALLWTNTPLKNSYSTFVDYSLLGGPSLLFWVNDLLMAVFFFLVGLEIKRELIGGELASPRQAALPALGALGGMLIPAGIFAVINWGQPSAAAWGIPIATDIAFALGTLRLLGSGVPLGLKVFLSALAIVDDIGALVVIAVFLTPGLAIGYLGGALAAVAMLFVLAKCKARSPWPFLLVGGVLWWLTLQAGIHPTIAGVITALAIPADTAEGEEESPVAKLEHSIHPIIVFGVLPVFGLFNAGVTVNPELLKSWSSPLFLGIVLGLVVGKTLGIWSFARLATKAKVAKLPQGVTSRHLLGAGALGGIGFTMALFIASLSLPSAEELDTAKLAILTASLVAGLVGYLTLRGICKPEADDAAG